MGGSTFFSAKKPPPMFRLTMDYRLINTATITTAWPMPHIEAVQSDVQGATAFAVIEFCSGYWKLSLHADSQDLHAFMTPNGVVQTTRRTEGGCNLAHNFQACVTPCFATLREHTLAWIEDFVIHARDEKKLLLVLEKFYPYVKNRIWWFQYPNQGSMQLV